MKEYLIKNNEANQRFDKYLKKLLPNASTGFIYKMFRKKNITLNGKKAEGKEILKAGDSVKIFFSDETFDKFSQDQNQLMDEFKSLKALGPGNIRIIWEDKDILVASKPANMLSQKAKADDISANERLISYLINTGSLSFDDYKTFKPSVCNRLDRNTTGLILMGKSLQGLQRLSGELKDRSLDKYYRTIVKGHIDKPMTISAYLLKDNLTNKVSITKEEVPGSLYIKTGYTPIDYNGSYTLLEVHLITGRSHQIRAHLASIGHPVLGDPKYGDLKLNKALKLRCQLLHSYRMEFPSGQKYIAEEPEIFKKIMDR